MLKDERSEREMGNNNSNGSDKKSSRARTSDWRKAADEYALDVRLSKASRLADFLNYMAERCPFAYIPDNACVRAVEGHKHMPKAFTEETRKVRSRASSARTVLMAKYGRCLLMSARGTSPGMRASVDDDDASAYQLPKNIIRLGSAKNSTDATLLCIQQSKIRSPALKAFVSAARAATHALEGDDRWLRLLPKPSEPQA
jgi:hypothetical protein